MRNKFASAIAITAISAVIPATAFADLSAEEVWTSWESYMESFGYEVVAESQSTDGGTLTLEGLSMTLPVPDEVSARMTLDWLKFTELGDGRVEITLAPDAPFSMSGTNPDGGSIDMTAVMRQTGLSLIASGNPGDITYDYSADTMAVGFDKFIIDGDAMEPVLDMQMAGLDGTVTMRQGDMWFLSGSSAIGSLNMDMAFEDPESGQNVKMNMSATDAKTTSEAIMPMEMDLEDPAWMINSGFLSSGNMTLGSASFSMEMDGEDAFSLNSQSGASTLDFKMGDGGLAYAGSSKDQVMTFASPALPLPPLTVSLGESAFDFAMPMAATEEPADFRMVLRMLELGVDEMLWQMIDPASMLPHDPADLVFDFSGTAIMPDGMMDPDAAMDDMAEPELHSLNVNEIKLAIAGAEIRGNGAFTFDNSDMETFDGFPAPEGSVGFDLFGINGLLDTLTAMGLLPEDQAMGARMLMGLFARPGGGGEDHLTSEIEVKSDGSVFANGQQLR